MHQLLAGDAVDIERNVDVEHDVRIDLKIDADAHRSGAIDGPEPDLTQ